VSFLGELAEAGRACTPGVRRHAGEEEIVAVLRRRATRARDVEQTLSDQRVLFDDVGDGVRFGCAEPANTG
jgi:hypothetical protein